MSTDLMSYLRRYRPGISREEVAVAAGVSIATLARRLREGLDADEVMKAARAIGAPPVEALIELGLLASAEIDAVTRSTSIDQAPDRVLLEELLARSIEAEPVDAHDREEAGLPPVPPSRFTVAPDPADELADAADDTPDWAREDEERETD
jgi:transcriptional regulator with XRE-family HTH domain